MTVAAEPLSEFIEEQLQRWPRSRDVAGHVARKLLDAAFFGERGVARRRPVISADGTPVMLSFQEAGGEEAPPFRLLTEPGLPSLAVCDQIDLTLNTLNGVLADLQWQRACAPVNAVVRVLFPERADAVESWWGGMGLGCSLDAHGFELRLYCNVREGVIESRWRRIAGVLALFGNIVQNGDALRAFIEHASQSAIPAGVALCIRDGAIRGVRVYLALAQPSAQTICDLGALDYRAREVVARICQVYPDVRPFTYGCVTTAFDFAVSRDQTHIDLHPVRFKADFDCTPDPLGVCAELDAIADWLSRMHRLCDLPEQRLCDFLDSLTRRFAGWTADYVSFGWRRGASEITTYVLPAGYATLHTT